MSTYDKCQFLGGWTSEQDLEDNFNFQPSNEDFFLIFKDNNPLYNFNGIVIFAQNLGGTVYFAYVARDYSQDYNTQANFYQNYFGDKSGFLSALESNGCLSDLTDDQKQTLLDTINNY